MKIMKVFLIILVIFIGVNYVGAQLPPAPPLPSFGGSEQQTLPAAQEPVQEVVPSSALQFAPPPRVMQPQKEKGVLFWVILIFVILFVLIMLYLLYTLIFKKKQEEMSVPQIQQTIQPQIVQPVQQQPVQQMQQPQQEPIMPAPSPQPHPATIQGRYKLRF